MKITLIKTKDKKQIIILGKNGLIGNAIYESLIYYSASKPGLDIVKDFEIDKRFLVDEFRVICNQYIVVSPKIITYIIFACGKGGFNITEQESNSQKELLKALLKNLYIIERLNTYFFYISSIGAHLSSFNTPYKSLIDSNEKELMKYKNTHILRLPGVWGIKSIYNKIIPSGLIANILYSTKRQNSFYIYSRSDTLRNYISAQTVGKAIYNLITNHQSFDLKNQINIISQFSYTIFDLIYIVEKITHIKLNYQFKEYSSYDIESLIASNSNGEKIYVLESIYTDIHNAWKDL